MSVEQQPMQHDEFLPGAGQPRVTVYDGDHPFPPPPKTPEHQRRAVVVGYLHGETVTGRFHASLMDMVLADVTGPGRILPHGGLIELESGPNLAAGRNELVMKFLTYSSADWLLMLDADGIFAPDLLERLMEVADEDKAPIVGGLCFSAGTDGVLPTLYDLVGSTEAPQPVRYTEWPENTMFPVFATGAACLLVHRKVLRAIRDYRDPEKPRQFGFSAAYPWFQEIDFYGMRMGEDVTFCLRAGMCGFPVYVHTGIQLGHRKAYTFTSADFYNPEAAK